MEKGLFALASIILLAGSQVPAAYVVQWDGSSTVVPLAGPPPTPSEMKKLLAEVGIGKAQIVVGSGAPGRERDRETGLRIKEAVAERLGVRAPLELHLVPMDLEITARGALREASGTLEVRRGTAVEARVPLVNVAGGDDLTSALRKAVPSLQNFNIRVREVRDSVFALTLDYLGPPYRATDPQVAQFLRPDQSEIWVGFRVEERTPVLQVKDEDSADKTVNLVLVGGPVANGLTRELVAGNLSKVDWYKSPGEVEVVRDAFAPGMAVIIVAGKDREATAKAAEALVWTLS
ncbi:MAG: S-layer protein [Candidatus Hydrothermarchaeota archaeon]